MGAVPRLAGSIVVVISLLGLAGSSCREPNPAWQGPASGDSASTGSGSESGVVVVPSTGTEGGGSGGESGRVGTTEASGSASEGSGTGPPPPMCSDEGMLGVGECPTECSSCSDGICQIDCLDGDCRDSLVACPQGWYCNVACDGRNSCRDATVVCPDASNCAVGCSGRDACRALTVTCGSSACALSCTADSNVCDDAILLCGASDSRVFCEDPVDNLQAVPGTGSCACEALGCV